MGSIEACIQHTYRVEPRCPNFLLMSLMLSIFIFHKHVFNVINSLNVAETNS